VYIRITNLTAGSVTIEGDTQDTRSLTRILPQGKFFDIRDIPYEQVMAVASIRALEPVSIRVDKVYEAGDIVALSMPPAADSDGFYSPICMDVAISSLGATGTRGDTTLKSAMPFAFRVLEMQVYPSTPGATRTVSSTAYANVSNVQTITCAAHGIVAGELVSFNTTTAGGDVIDLTNGTPVLRTTATTIVIANSGGDSSATEAGTITVLPTVQLTSHAAYQVASTAYANVSNVQTITVASHTFAVGDYVVFDTVTAGGDVLTATPVISCTATTVVIANAGGNSSATEAGMLSRSPYRYSNPVLTSGTTIASSTLGIPLTAALNSGLVLAKSDRNFAGRVVIKGVRV